MLGFFTKTKALDRSRTGTMTQDEVLTLMDWTPEQYRAAQGCGLETVMVIRDRALAADPRGQVTAERRVHVHVLVRWLEQMQAIDLTATRIDELLGE